MKNTIKLAFLTLPSALIYVGAYVVFVIAALATLPVHFDFVQNIPFLGEALNSPVSAGMVAIAMAFVALIAKPINFATDHDSFLMSLVNSAAMCAALYVIIPIVAFICISISPLAVIKLFGGESFMLLPAIGFLLLIGQAFINIRLADLD